METKKRITYSDPLHHPDDLLPFLEGVFRSLSREGDLPIEKRFANAIVVDSKTDSYRPDYRFRNQTEGTVILEGLACTDDTDMEYNLKSRLIIRQIQPHWVVVRLVLFNRDCTIWNVSGDVIFDNRRQFAIGKEKSW